jgi:hypothetical protein
MMGKTVLNDVLSINNGGFPLGVHEEIHGFPSFGRGCKFASEIGEHPFNM